MKSIFFFLFYFVFTNSSPINSNPSNLPSKHVQNEQDAEKFLKSFGYMSNDASGDEKGPADIKDLSNSIKKLQRFAGLPQTGKLDEKTLELMNTPRCQLPDPVDEEEQNSETSNFSMKTEKNPKKRYVLEKSKWYKSFLSYFIQNSPNLSSLSRGQVESAIATAFKDWSSVANINFYRTSSQSSDVKVGFYSGNHGDGFNFDGSGGTLAHAFSPQDGRLHFDNAEYWTNGKSGTNLRQVATHEIGHILGIDHSNTKGAIMYPYYNYRSNFQLHPDDIRGVRALYGKRIKSYPQTPKFIPRITITQAPTTTYNYNSYFDNWYLNWRRRIYGW